MYKYSFRFFCLVPIEDSAAACPPLKSNPPSKLTVKAQFLCEQEARVSRQTTQHTTYSKATENVDFCIKFRKFLQRFAVFSAQRLQTQSFLQYLRTEDLEYAFGNDRKQVKRSETDAASQKDTTGTSNAITTMSSVQRCIIQQRSTNPPLVPIPEGYLHSTQTTRCTATRRHSK